MNEKELLTLRVINHYNLDGPMYEDLEKDTNWIVAKSLTRILSQYTEQIKNNYSIIIDYNNDVYSLLSYIIINNCYGILKKKPNIQLLGILKSKEEKQFFDNVKTINYHKAKKEKKAILITGFHPIYNVIDTNLFSKDFIDIINPIERFTPNSIDTLCDWYIKDELQEVLKKNNIGEEWKNFYTLPINSEKLPEQLPKLDMEIPICIFNLYGQRDNFSYYDFILKSSNEGNIHLYKIKSTEENFNKEKDYLQLNLNGYIDFRNGIRDFNLIENEVNIPDCNIFYSDDFKGDENNG